jgi:hypothetical protein
MTKKVLYEQYFDLDDQSFEQPYERDMADFHLAVIKMLIDVGRPITEINQYVMQKKLDYIKENPKYIDWECPYCQSINSTKMNGQIIRFELGKVVKIKGLDSCLTIDCEFNNENILKGRKFI